MIVRSHALAALLSAACLPLACSDAPAAPPKTPAKGATATDGKTKGNGAKTPKKAEPSTTKSVIGPKSLPPRVRDLARSGSPKMQELIQKARALEGQEAAEVWVTAAKRAQAAREIPSALDLYQLAQRAAPTFCPGFTGARTLLTELGKPAIALMVLASERSCEGANKIALKAEAERLQELLVVDEHGHEGKKGAAPKPRPRPTKAPLKR